MTGHLQQSMLTHIQQLPESAQMSLAAVLAQPHMPTGHFTCFSLYCSLSHVCFYVFFVIFVAVSNLKKVIRDFLGEH